jgi:hypothetical protein
MTFFRNKSEKDEIASNYPRIHQTANSFIKVFGSTFTGTPNGHIETDIAGASAISGLMLLRALPVDLAQHKPGTIILSEIHEAQDKLFHFLTNVAFSMGINPKSGWNNKILTEHQPLFGVLELTQKLEPPFYKACTETGISKEFYQYVAGLTAMKLVATGSQMRILDADIGKSITSFYVVAGAKTVPYPLK